MADEAIVTIKSDAEIGLGLLNDPKDVDILDGPDLVLPAGRILRLMIEMMAQRGNEPRRYILYANLNGRWYPIDRLVRPGRVRPTDLLWLFAFPGVGLHPEAEENVIVKLNPTREQLLDLALWSTIRDTIGSRMLAPPGSLWFGRDQIIRKIGFLLGVRLWDIEWAGRSPGERQQAPIRVRPGARGRATPLGARADLRVPGRGRGQLVGIPAEAATRGVGRDAVAHERSHRARPARGGTP